ncbi:MAG TPA: ABC transporter ATP-binding protein [Hypericibacter adhaerens]|jgi:putative spermidine/putrescine transport system ATP-binding protein|uniref:ABC transporter ATP-binding protein n=1 Tax=Hypericibacter adhaerens TaxID=2602016 RepID=A0A5J6N750_9PROT|nr:ABC transporter ATP-binding protein [Hypericibacter adhaerens]QEX24613.1 ABC transporter ATP-binding protein [Hypericibacter adhaerens]HWA45824.1 ABC transporter ATP-binding protein [Hypericibacter adhaerens]
MTKEAAPGIVSLRNLVKRFGAVTAVDGVSLEVGEGEFLTFLGSSGSGKTTTLFIVAGFEDATSGDVLIDGKSVLGVPPHRRNIGMVFQRYTLFPHLNVHENVAFPLSVRHRPKAEIEAAVKEALRLVRLESYAERKPGALSGGQQQRVALARALVYRPRFLLMDEPLAALDKRLREEIQGEIRRIHQETGVTVLYVTHDQEEALRLSDRIAVFSHGRIEQVGTGIDLYQSPKTAFVAGFIGNSNFIAGTVEGSGNNGTAVRLPDGNLCAINGTKPPEGSRSVSLMIRPERVRLCTSAAATGSDCAVKVRIREITFLGENLHYTATTDWGQVLSIRESFSGTASGPLAVGSEAYAAWRPADLHLFPS